MTSKHSHEDSGCGCCRRDFLTAAAAGAALTFHHIAAGQGKGASGADGQRPATVRGAFVYQPSDKLHGNWWSWPGNDFDAEGRQKKYSGWIADIAKTLGMRIDMNPKPLHTGQGVKKFIADVAASKPDGLLLIPFHHPSFTFVNQILKGTKWAIPTVIYSCLGVKHGPITGYQRPGVSFVQTLDNRDAIAYAMRMIHARHFMANSRILSVTGSKPTREAEVPFWGTKVRVIPIQQFTDQVDATKTTSEVQALAADFAKHAKKKLEPKQPAILEAARVHFANKQLMKTEQSDAITMNCLRRGEKMPCMSFMTLRDEGIAAGCENDLYPTLTMMLLQHLFDRPGFQHNPAFDTEQNHYFASHCTSASKLFGTDAPQEPHLLRSFAHTNDPTCVPQVLWREGEPVTMVQLTPGKTPGMLLYSGSVVKSYDMPPVGGCRTNVAITINEMDDASGVKGHHNILIYGDFRRRLEQFARLYGIKVLT